MASKNIEIVHGFEQKVAETIRINRQLKKFKEAIDIMKVYFRAQAETLLGVGETSLKFAGEDAGIITVSAPLKPKPALKTGKKIENMPQELRAKFYTAEIKYVPVDNFEELSENDPAILDWVKLEFSTPMVTIPE